ncbi:MAG: transposase [Saprospiraceae bacterium]
MRNFDYSSVGSYFVTVDTRFRAREFGAIINGEMHLSDIGAFTQQCIADIPLHFPSILVPEFVVMPDHIHIILDLGSSYELAKVQEIGAQDEIFQLKKNRFSKPIAGSVSVVIQQLKAAVKRWCNNNGHEHFQWLGRFHVRLIQNEDAFRRIQRYIQQNPSKWKY